jgi:spheroidene monooxygenase
MGFMIEPGQTTSLSVFRFAGLGARAWAFSQMLFARRSMARLPEVGFWKLFGSGSGEGFTPIPNTGVYGILATWPSLEAAMTQTRDAAVYQRYRDQSAENWTVFLQTSSARGQWDGEAPFEVTTGVPDGALAALTRATLRPSIMLKFWQRVPSISAAIGSDPNIAFKIGLGEVPWFQQVTFSIWPDTESMAAFARRDGPHARAIKAVRDGQWFAEELYARFHIVGSAGSWNGGDPLQRLRKPQEAQAA